MFLYAEGFLPLINPSLLKINKLIMKFCYFPIQVLKSQEGLETKTELKDGRIIIGNLEEMDIFMNLKMTNVKVIKEGSITNKEMILIRGTQICGV